MDHIPVPANAVHKSAVGCRSSFISFRYVSLQQHWPSDLTTVPYLWVDTKSCFVEPVRVLLTVVPMYTYDYSYSTRTGTSYCTTGMLPTESAGDPAKLLLRKCNELPQRCRWLFRPKLSLLASTISLLVDLLARRRSLHGIWRRQPPDPLSVVRRYLVYGIASRCS